MIWLGSFPRSGNTFLRNVLFEVYGLESSSYFEGIGEPLNYQDFAIVKTHMRPSELIPPSTKIPAIYLVRDGRDALVSMAYQRKEIYEPESDFRQNFIEAMIAAEESYFGGWSINVNDWFDRATVVLRFEDLIQDPINQVNRIAFLLPLPEPKLNKLPSFKDLKYGQPKYGRGKRIASSEEEELDIIRKSFRKGKAFGWKEELDRELQNLFWSYHRNTMEKLGYSREGGIVGLNPDFDYQALGLLENQDFPSPSSKYRVLIEANKLLMHQNDGIKRYLVELLKALYPVVQNPNARWEIDLFLKGRIYPLKDYGANLFNDNPKENHFNTMLRVSKLIRGFLKQFVPKAYREKFMQHLRQGMIKMGLKFAKLIHQLDTLKQRLKGSKESSENHFKPYLGGEELESYDLVHVPLPQHFEPFKGKKNNYLLTLHDLTHRLFSEYHTSNNVKKAEQGLQFFLDEKAHFLCVSEATKMDLLKEVEIEEHRLHMVYAAADNLKFRPNLYNNKGLQIRTKYGIPEGTFLFTLSTLEPRKNLINTIKAFDKLLDAFPDTDIHLVIGGKNGWKSNDLMQLRHKKQIIFTGFIDESDLPILYNEAEALCYVSHYEGFGLPPLEAMACKTPVIYGNNSSMKELLENYGLAADSNDVDSIKKQMERILFDPIFTAELKEKSLERSFDFSWRKTAIETLGVYEEIIVENHVV